MHFRSDRFTHNRAVNIIGIRKTESKAVNAILVAKRNSGKVERLEVLFKDLRDDIAGERPDPVVTATEIPFDVTGQHVILVDDVLSSGSTIRATTARQAAMIR